tara:strand:+ start:437 stop:736 length:300 start_codon:yes stop_codon:yes gene_type:complete
MKIQPLGLITVAEGQGSATTLEDAQQVLVQNTQSSVRYIHIQPNGSSGYDSSVDFVFAIQGNKSVLVRKDYDEEIYATEDLDGETGSNDVFFTKTGFYA